MMDETTLLEQAKERIINRRDWWGHRKPAHDDDQKMCALQALVVAASRVEPLAARVAIRRQAESRLNKTSRRLYDYLDITSVNDYVGWKAVMRCYDEAIKETRSESVPRVVSEADLAVAGD